MAEYANSKRAWGLCDRCGFRYRLGQLKELAQANRNTGLLVCPTCWDPSHPQLELGKYPVDDPQALRNPRPDNAGYAQSRALYWPVSGVRGFTLVGSVTVTT